MSFKFKFLTALVATVAASLGAGAFIFNFIAYERPTMEFAQFLQALPWLVACFAFLCLIFGVAMHFWFARPITKIADFAQGVTKGQRLSAPKFATAEWQALASALEQMKEALELKSKREEFLGGLITELKAPLAEISTSSNILAIDPPLDRRRELSQVIQLHVDRMSQLLNETHSLIKLEARRQLNHRTHFNLDDLLKRISNHFDSRVKRERMELKITAPDYCQVEGEIKLIEQALIHLLNNAIEFSDEHSTIELFVKEKKGKIEFIVRDQGAGVPDFALPFVFKKYYALPRPNQIQQHHHHQHRQQHHHQHLQQNPVSQNPQLTKSTGLGLAVVKEIAHLHRGDVKLASPPPGLKRGTEVRLSMPL